MFCDSGSKLSGRAARSRERPRGRSPIADASPSPKTNGKRFASSDGPFRSIPVVESATAAEPKSKWTVAGDGTGRPRKPVASSFSKIIYVPAVAAFHLTVMTPLPAVAEVCVMVGFSRPAHWAVNTSLPFARVQILSKFPVVTDWLMSTLAGPAATGTRSQ